MPQVSASNRRYLVHSGLRFTLYLLLMLWPTLPAADARSRKPVSRRRAAALRVTPGQAGLWENSFSTAPLVHMSVMPDGHVLHWTQIFTPPTYTRRWRCELIPAENNDQSKLRCDPTQPGEGPGRDVWYYNENLFCSGHSLLPDGRLLVTGGTFHFIRKNGTVVHGGVYDGINAATTYRVGDPTLTATTPMEYARWYPTNVALGSGETVTASGSYCAERDPLTQACACRRYDPPGVCAEYAIENAVYPEVFSTAPGSPPVDSWRTLKQAERLLPLYPWLHFASNGKVFYSGPEQQSAWLDTTGDGEWTDGPISSAYRESGSAVLYDTDRVLIAGGGSALPTNTAETIDLSAGKSASWQPTDSMEFPRKHHNLTLLADGSVLAVGGTQGPGFNSSCGGDVVYKPEIWKPSDVNPSDGTWTTMAPMSYRRQYHSTAVLLIDGSVLVGGTTEQASTAPICRGFDNVYQTEIFSPPYLFNADGSRAARPILSYAPTAVTYGQQFFVGAPGSLGIARVTMVRLSSVTHSIDMNQRINKLTFRAVGGGLRVTAPSGSNVCPPGHYMLFLINGAGTPSIAKIVQIS